MQRHKLTTYLPLMLASLVASVVVYSAIAATHPMLPVPKDLFGLMQPNQEQSERLRIHHRLNDKIALTMLGAVGAVAGVPYLSRRMSIARRALTAIAATLLGALCGWAMGEIGFYCYDWLPITLDVLVLVAIRWTAMLLPLGIVAALLAIVCRRAWNKAGTLLVAGLMGATLAAITYSLLVGVLFQNENSDAVLPRGISSQFLLFALIPLLIWATIAHQEAAVTQASDVTAAELEVV